LKKPEELRIKCKIEKSLTKGKKGKAGGKKTNNINQMQAKTSVKTPPRQSLGQRECERQPEVLVASSIVQKKKDVLVE